MASPETVGLLVLQDVIENDQNFVRERHDGFVFPTTARHAMIDEAKASACLPRALIWN